ncbi:replicative DNA helicase [Hirschia baltica]|uniref:Replicative DNA helicase n=1 Tax=Hirschia baltica (strain ATCC 49814 / DSM 5838 / IFAM 1418) TaxID=582402 RepID=C6XKR1_HIRBI|nr:replicative DNA helicase [Hirschia baltica]ACT59628.1 replicative DNA helicase [Hirschia baltica ATCC 49814]
MTQDDIPEFPPADFPDSMPEGPPPDGNYEQLSPFDDLLPASPASGNASAPGKSNGSAGTGSTADEPHNLAAEMAVLGAILYDNNAYQRVGDILLGSDFYAPANTRIYETAQSMIMKGRVADGVTLMEQFENDGIFSDIGGAQYLTTLLDSSAFGPEIVDYARLIRDLAIRRELMQIGSSIVQYAAKSEGDMDGAGQIEAAEKQLFALAERGTAQGGFVTFHDAVAKSIEDATIAYQSDGGLSGISTGLDDLDQKIGGLHSSDLLILAGRPSMGKTALATNIAFNVAKACVREKQPDDSYKSVEGGVVGFYSLEMSADQLAGRILADVSCVPSDKIRRGDMDENDYAKLREAAKEIERIPLHIDDTGGISISQLAARARRLQRSSGLDLLVIDYLQLVTAAAGSKSDSRVQEVSQITMAMKSLAKELAIPVIALSQLSRKVEERDDKRPQLSDLRESGSIEQDADMVMFVYRESYYLERQEPDENNENFLAWKERMESKAGKAEVIVAKQRHGPIGKVELAFDSNRVRFGNLAPAFRSNDNYDDE